jgi:hypothetical protein
MKSACVDWLNRVDLPDAGENGMDLSKSRNRADSVCRGAGSRNDDFAHTMAEVS